MDISIEEKEVSQLRESMAYLRGIVEQMDKRLNHIESELRSLREYIENSFGHLESRLWWIIGIQISTWISIVAVLIQILLKMK
ncbi:hypothetical protein Igag_0829 [Ignisphaera aggregans DSM 17230]|uniref:Uncharacterized protein n=1 Tax=Ignisphaera aggregans (strain DSM 17230 / JCM 13409 / AQ1.S1) TaxID=583356 RepID=E0STN6_IGNAA|nr:hypothetical protein Igag_0829 [Ignisphaera aggregans DSM 17230]